MQDLRGCQPAQVPVLLTIAGFDPSSGAGLTADLKVFAAHDFFGLCCPTLLTVQSTRGVERSEPVSAELVRDTLLCLANDFSIAGVKIGALGSEEVVEAVAAWLETALVSTKALPVVLDPVLRASSGAALLTPGAEDALRLRLLPLASVVTPNLAEAAALAATELRGARAAADVEELAASMRTAMRGRRRGAVVITGGHLERAPDDYLLESDAAAGLWFRGAWVDTTSTHGTGCAFSSALLCELVCGLALPDAVARAKEYVRGALQAAYPLGGGRGPLHHFYRFASRPALGDGKRGCGEA